MSEWIVEGVFVVDGGSCDSACEASRANVWSPRVVRVGPPHSFMHERASADGGQRTVLAVRIHVCVAMAGGEAITATASVKYLIAVRSIALTARMVD